jgi:molybdenum cofactor cytidylyltransferase
MDAERHDAVLLAAGGSRRLGRPKQLLTRSGETLLRRAARLLAGTRPRAFVVVLGADAEALAGELDGLDLVVALNPAWREGLASSLQCAARAFGRSAAIAGHPAPNRDDPSCRVLVAVCDQPALEAHHLATLLRTQGCAATRHGTGLGVPAILARSTWQRVGELAGDRGFSTLLDPAECSAIEAPALARDLDTHADVVRAIAAGLIDPDPGL